MKKLLILFGLIACFAFVGCGSTEESVSVDTEQSESDTLPDESDIREKVPDALMEYIRRHEDTDVISISKTEYEIGTIEYGKYKDYDTLSGTGELYGWQVYGTYTLYRKDGSLYANKSFTFCFESGGDFLPKSSSTYKR